MKKIGKASAPIPKKILMVLIGGLCGLSVMAQDLSNSVNKDQVPPGGRLKYSIKLSGAKGKIAPPDFDGFRSVHGPSKSTQVRMVNGQVSRSMTITYTLVAPQKEGSIKIEPPKARTSGGILKGKTIEIEVKKGSGGKPKVNTSTGERNKKVIGRIELNRSKVYKGEPVRVSYMVYSRYKGFAWAKRPDIPSIEGAWSEIIENDQNARKGLVKIDGKPYQKFVVQQRLIFPQKAGSIKIEPFTATSLVGRGLFSKGKKIKIRSNTPTLQVKALPDTAPEHFHGAVGNLKMQAELDRDTVKINGSVNLKVKLQGSGNLSLVDEPQVKIPPDLERYDPNTKDRVQVGMSNMRGIKEWEYLLVPRQSGNYKIGPVSMTYFDPSAESYRTLEAGPFELQVSNEKAEGTDVAQKQKAKAKEEVDVLEKELRYVRSDLQELQKRKDETPSLLLDLLPIFPPILGGLFLLFWKRKRGSHDQERTRARKTARARLKDAEKALKRGDRAEFHEELYKGLCSYLSDRTGIAQAQLSKERIAERMKAIGIPEGSVQRTVRNLEHSEMLRYAPSQSVSDEEVHEETVNLLAELESYWK